MSLKKFDDNFNSLVKSLKPIKYKYSKESIKHDKTFKKLSIGQLEKNLNIPKKPPENFYNSKLYKNLDYIYNISNEPYDYMQNISGEKNIPLNIKKNGLNFIKYLYNPEFETKKDDNNYFYNDNKNKNKFKTKFYNNKNVIKLKIFALDPGYYHPNYNYVKKRIPSIDFSKSLNSHENDNISKIIKENKYNEENYIDKNINEDNYKINKIIKDEKNKNDKNIIIEQNLRKNNSIKNYNNSSQIILPKINKEEIKTKKLNSKILHRASSQRTISTKGIISFKKMMGRYNKRKRMKQIDKIDNEYNPNYNSTLPHVRSFIFKFNGNKQNKKYILGKILRSYNINSYGYFAMDINRSNS